MRWTSGASLFAWEGATGVRGYAIQSVPRILSARSDRLSSATERDKHRAARSEQSGLIPCDPSDAAVA